jgi:hypothetical protein
MSKSAAYSMPYRFANVATIITSKFSAYKTTIPTTFTRAKWSAKCMSKPAAYSMPY